MPLRSNTLRLKSSPKLSDALLNASCKSYTSNNIFFSPEPLFKTDGIINSIFAIYIFTFISTYIIHIIFYYLIIVETIWTSGLTVEGFGNIPTRASVDLRPLPVT